MDMLYPSLLGAAGAKIKIAPTSSSKQEVWALKIGQEDVFVLEEKPTFIARILVSLITGMEYVVLND